MVWDDGLIIRIGLCMKDYESVCAAVMICATLVDPKLIFFYILTVRVTSKSKSN